MLTNSYKGYQLARVEGIILWAFLSPVLIIDIRLITLSEWVSLSVFSGFGLLWFLFWFWRFYYFELNENSLTIRMHNLFWYKRSYRLDDIEEVAFETKPKMPYCLRVTTKDFKSRLYPAVTLNDKTWAQLKEDLENKNIAVRNECVTYQPRG